QLLCLHSEFFAALFYGDFDDGKGFSAEIRSIDGETFDICSVFGSLLQAMHGRYTPIVCSLILADRFCMDPVKSRISSYLISSDLSFLVFFNIVQWIRAADMARCDQLVDKLVEKATRPIDLLSCYESLHESVSKQTLLKLVRKLYTVSTAPTTPSFDFTMTSNIKPITGIKKTGGA
ncbi:hypothetical protein PFISCL1PPCAC_21760, partial [Pristionchus fissidentatus]